jgi:hypothetical protein
MPSFTMLRNQARSIASASVDPDIQTLARIVEQLCSECDDLESKVKRAQDDADDAMRKARRG